MNKDRFHLESDIQDCWNVTNDIEAIVWRHLDSPEGPLPDEDLRSALMGLASLYNIKFCRTMDTMSRVFNLDEYRDKGRDPDPVMLMEQSKPE